MSIRFIKDKKRFIINTKHTTYAFDVVLDHYLYHTYYGKRTSSLPDPSFHTVSFSPYLPGLSEAQSPDVFPQECSFYGSGDFRPNALRLSTDGTGVSDFVYHSYRIFKGRMALDGLPAARADERTQTLEITLLDSVSGCRLMLYYTVFSDVDVISRYMIVENNGGTCATIEKCMSLMLDLNRSDLDMISLYGSHCNELNFQRAALHHGTQSVYSKRGASSHQYNPFIALCDHSANEERGEVYGFNFVYSGSFLNEVDVDQLGHTRVLVGLGSDCFTWRLQPGEVFCSPEAIMTYSPAGIGAMTRNLHRFARAHILPKAAHVPHPVVLNTWEACYFDIDQDKLIRFAKEAGETGFDMLVMDDGWFGLRNHDRAGLGDWYENPAKFPDGLASFVEKIKAQGVKFGIWVEPEMVNPDSELYRAHPDWALQTEGREPLRSRHQLVLDMSNPAVIEYLIDRFDRTFQGIEIDYFKWDMNRHMSNVGSCRLPADKQGEIFFRYMKGVYRLFDWFAARFPNAVIETCSGGGGRYDLGMMPYGIQIWTSDNTDPYARTMIQSSALIAYPAMTMSCHVSNPHENLGSLDYRYKVALGGMLGYELNILNMSEEVKQTIAAQIAQYKSLEHIIRLGDYYSLASPTKYDYSAYYYASSDARELLLTVIEKRGCPAGSTKRLRIKAARTDALYTNVITGKTYSGEELRAGIRIGLNGTDDSAHLLYLKML